MATLRWDRITWDEFVLGTRVRKTMAKYLDEYNWYVMVGAERALR